MMTFLGIVVVWTGLNIGLFGFILYQRSPNFRHRLFRATTGLFAFPSERRLAHALVDAAHHHR
jgi:hypothetical protein